MLKRSYAVLSKTFLPVSSTSSALGMCVVYRWGPDLVFWCGIVWENIGIWDQHKSKNFDQPES